MARKAKAVESPIPAVNAAVVDSVDNSTIVNELLAAKLEAASTDIIILDPENAHEESKDDQKVDILHLRFGIDQLGADVDGALSERQYFEIKLVNDPKKPLDLVTIAGQFGRQMWSVIRHLPHKNKKVGFNLNFYIDNQLSGDYSMKAGGKLKFDSPVNVAYGILGILAAQFDNTNADAFLTGKVKQSPEINLVSDRLGFNEKAKNLPFEYLEPVYEAKRKAVRQEFQKRKKELLAV
jgi:hypothetical protein